MEKGEHHISFIPFTLHLLLQKYQCLKSSVISSFKGTKVLVGDSLIIPKIDRTDDEGLKQWKWMEKVFYLFLFFPFSFCLTSH